MATAQHGDTALEQREPQPIVSIRATIPVSQIGDEMGARLALLADYLQQSGATAAGPLFVRYHSFGETETDMETGLPVATPVAGAGRVTPGTLPGGPAVTTWHFGSHQSLGEAYGRIGAWLQEHGRGADGSSWEVYYWIDPSRNPDPAGWQQDHTVWGTQLVQPVK
ncbi:MAG TPA: GyrI-like domain-containing protein [Chloroflexia bacterium]|nr:GyrI-like domain-containing protein [Chloroflexia bacterium]